MSESRHWVETRDESLTRIATDAGRVAAGETLALHLSTIEARDYQVSTWNALENARAEGADSALVHLATGLGKTTVGAVEVLKYIGERRETTGNTPRVLFVCHQVEILDQASKRFMEFAPALSQGKYADGQKEIDADITFATFQSLQRDLAGIDTKQFEYVIYDEAHHAQAETFKQVVEHFQPDFKLALTATPERMDRERIEDLFGEPVYAKPLAIAMTEGYLADVDYHIVFDDAVKKAMDQDFTPNTLREIRELLKNTSRNEEIAHQITEEMERIGLADAKTIIFCQDIDQADQMAKLLDGKPYHSSLPQEDRRDTLSEFRANGLQVIATRDMFNEGVDIPDARLLVFLRSTSSRTVFEQQLGRGLRKTGVKDTVSVLDFVANIERLGQIKEITDQIMEYKNLQQIDPGSVNTEVEQTELKLHADHVDFDFDKLSVVLLAKLSKVDRPTVETIEEAAELWRDTFGDIVPSSKLLNRYSKEGTFISTRSIKSMGGLDALRSALGTENPPETIEEAAALWKEKFGDLEPTLRLIEIAANKGEFISKYYIGLLGGSSELKRALGVIEKDFSSIETVEDAAALWKEKFGDLEPTIALIKHSNSNGEFISTTKTFELGGIRALRQALGLKAVADRKITLEQAAALWREKFGDTVPTFSLIEKLSKEREFISTKTVANFGGIGKLKEALGIKQLTERITIETIEDAAALWREKFGDLEPKQSLINQASKDRKFVSYNLLKKLGGIKALESALGIEENSSLHVETIEDAAALWKEKFGDVRPTAKLVGQASKDGVFFSNSYIYKLGGIKALQSALGVKEKRFSSVKTIEDAAALWKENLGETKPTAINISDASKAGLFVSRTVIDNLGGILAMQEVCKKLQQ